MSDEPKPVLDIYWRLVEDLGQRRLATIRTYCSIHKMDLHDIGAIHRRLGVVCPKLSAEDYAALLVAVHTHFTPRE